MGYWGILPDQGDRPLDQVHEIQRAAEKVFETKFWKLCKRADRTLQQRWEENDNNGGAYLKGKHYVKFRELYTMLAAKKILDKGF